MSYTSYQIVKEELESTLILKLKTSTIWVILWKEGSVIHNVAMRKLSLLLVEHFDMMTYSMNR